LHILRAKQQEFDDFVRSIAREWHVNTITITGNMGMDNREKQATSFWNKFQSVFWERIHTGKDAGPVKPGVEGGDGEQLPDYGMSSFFLKDTI